MKPLSEMSTGSSGFVSKILGNRQDYHRITDMGIGEGMKIEVEDILDNLVFYIKVNKTSMVLLKKDCDLIIMEKEKRERTEHVPFLMPLWPGFGFGYGQF